MSSSKLVLIVDDERDIAELLEYQLKQAGYRTKKAFNGKQAIELAQAECPHLILLDVSLPVMDGIAVCLQLRENPLFDRTFIVFLTARAEEYTEVAGFEAGGDDFIQKPVKPRALMKRLSALFNRERTDASGQITQDLTYRQLRLSREKYILVMKGEDIALPKKEFEILWLLMANPNRVYSRDMLLKAVWEPGVEVIERTVDVHIRRIREKIGNEYIRTVKGVGYRLSSDDDSSDSL